MENLIMENLIEKKLTFTFWVQGSKFYVYYQYQDGYYHLDCSNGICQCFKSLRDLKNAIKHIPMFHKGIDVYEDEDI